MFGAGKIVFAEQRLFIQAQVARDGAHKPVAKDPPGSFAQSSFSKAWTKRVLMRVALVSSSMETSRSSRSRFRRSPKFPLAMNPNLSSTIPLPREAVDYKGAAKRLMRQALAKNQRGIPQRTIGGAIQYCQTWPAPSPLLAAAVIWIGSSLQVVV